MEHLENKVAVVTGAASGIGRAMVDRFLAEGMRVVLADVEAGALAVAADELATHSDRVLAVTTDVSDADQVEVLARRALEAFGPVHLLCNNAGVTTFGPAWDFEPNDWRWVLNVNLLGVAHGIRSFVPTFIAQGEGHVVNTASMAGVATFPGLAPYTASKHAVVALSESLSLELQTIGSPVGVSVACPGFVRTRIGDSERNRPNDLASRRDAQTDAQAAQLLESGTAPEQVADAVADAVKQGRFWVFTHPEMLSAVEARMAAMLHQHDPAIAPMPG